MAERSAVRRSLTDRVTTTDALFPLSLLGEVCQRERSKSNENAILSEREFLRIRVNVTTIVYFIKLSSAYHVYGTLFFTRQRFLVIS